MPDFNGQSYRSFFNANSFCELCGVDGVVAREVDHIITCAIIKFSPLFFGDFPGSDTFGEVTFLDERYHEEDEPNAKKYCSIDGVTEPDKEGRERPEQGYPLYE